MVQNKKKPPSADSVRGASGGKRPRGRPRQFNEEKALEAAAGVFWTKGLSATSLDDLAEAMAMNRPSIYAAFGDKEALYRRALAQFCAGMRAAAEGTLGAEADVRRGLERFYDAALQVYTGGAQPLGCMVMSTAVNAAPCHPAVQTDLHAVLSDLDRVLAARFRAAVSAGQIEERPDAASRARLAQAVLHSLSIRARAGESPRQLRRFVREGVEAVLG